MDASGLHGTASSASIGDQGFALGQGGQLASGRLQQTETIDQLKRLKPLIQTTQDIGSRQSSAEPRVAHRPKGEHIPTKKLPLSRVQA
ncbi:hypothetical protein [Bradyrhizobium barranii]|uniref:Uncharacterized protein n=1 Tax=Bradyrhizobium barranii subsp. barranii TaxID=2823807 RepID=A0A7Z0Q7H5_9BRAD|nr:hypothetical protein [Bradyrhizobium barranii]UGX95251.1 hypothetical protein G6321_00008915 [Bradyrhizobium barranii subsp. barranii]